MTAFDLAHQNVIALVHRFQKGLDHYKSPKYQESELRQSFLDRFFTALGWDALHEQQQNPFEQEVHIERSQKQEGATAQKRAEYAFFLAPNFKDERFFTPSLV